MPWLSVNRITVETAPEADRIVEAFRHRAGKVDLQPGFLGIEVWRESEGREVLVATRWQRREDFEAWVNGPAFRAAHAKADGAGGSAHGSLYEQAI